MKTFTLIAILTCAVLVIFQAAAAEELEVQDVIQPEDALTGLATLEEDRIFECSFSCDIKRMENHVRDPERRNVQEDGDAR
uniref:U7-Theraphotoxin-Sfo1b_1 n=1 Tax=Selenotholus foelschei TaxID=1905327 RepID=A0A482ZHH6_9ARAC